MKPNFELFCEEMDIFFTETETTKKSKEIYVARILNVIGAEAKKIYFKIKDEIQDKSVNAILNELKTRCIPKRNLIMSQFKFFQQKQNLSALFDIFFTDLKELVKHYQFKDAEKQLMCIQIFLRIQKKELNKNSWKRIQIWRIPISTSPLNFRRKIHNKLNQLLQ